MHELAIAEGLVAAVLEKTGTQPVTAVRLSVGRLSGVLPDALSFSFDLATDGTTMEGAVLEVDDQPGLGWCRECRTSVTLPDFLLLCPCGSADVEVVGGHELQITSVEVS